MLEYIYSPRGTPLVILDNFLYRKNREKYWRCFRFAKYRCKARLIIDVFGLVKTAGIHTHGEEYEKINYGRKLRKALTANNTVQTTYRLPNIPSINPTSGKRTVQQQQEYSQNEELEIKKEEPDVD